MAEKYTDTALHFDARQMPKILENYMPRGPLALADVGCGDGPWFNLLIEQGYISPEKAVYAVDLEPVRLERAHRRFPWIRTVVSSADSIPEIETGTLDWVISTMVMEHVPDEVKYLREMARLLRPQGRAYVTTVYKRKWAWYFRKRDGETVLDRSHLREYTNLDAFRNLVTKGAGLEILAMDLKLLWFPVLDPLLFRIGKYVRLNNRLLRFLRVAKVPIPGYYELRAILAKTS